MLSLPSLVVSFSFLSFIYSNTCIDSNTTEDCLSCDNNSNRIFAKVLGFKGQCICDFRFYEVKNQKECLSCNSKMSYCLECKQENECLNCTNNLVWKDINKKCECSDCTFWSKAKAN